MSKEINLEEVFAEIYVPINDVIKRGEHIFDYNDMMLFAKAVVKKLNIADVIVSCCEPIGEGFFLGTTCPKCKQPFRQNLK